jgi:hypothetical protein
MLIKSYKERWDTVPRDYSGVIQFADGISQIQDCNVIEHLKDGLTHRKDGPAVIYSQYTIDSKSNVPPLRTGSFWYLHGDRHCETGPACEYLDGKTAYFLFGKEYYFQKEWENDVKKLGRFPYNITSRVFHRLNVRMNMYFNDLMNHYIDVIRKY